MPNEVMEQINTAGLWTIHQPPQKNQRCPRQNSCQTKERISRARIINRQSERFRAGKALQGHAAQCTKLQFPATPQKLDELPKIISTHFIGENFNTNICQYQATLSQDLVNVFSLYTKVYFGYRMRPFLSFLLLFPSYQRFNSRQISFNFTAHNTQDVMYLYKIQKDQMREMYIYLSETGLILLI